MLNPFLWGDSFVPLSYQATLISWIGCFGMNLIYKASRDGYSASVFHSICDYQGSTLVVVRSTGGYLFGGFHKGDWHSSGSYANGTIASQSFIFTLTNPYSTAPTKYHNKNSTYGPYSSSSYGPTFGGGHDLHISNACTTSGCYTNFPHSYNDTTGHGNNTFTGSYNFNVSDINVFRCNF